MLNLSVVIVLAILTLKMGWYLPLIWKRVVTPLPATYVIATAAMHLAWWSYWSIPNRTITENIVLFVAMIEVTVTLAVIVFVSWKHRDWGHPFDSLQKGYLLVMLLLFVCWSLNRDLAKMTFWTTQILLVVAYMATFLKIRHKGYAFDSPLNWGLLALGSLVGLIPAVSMESSYGIFNSIRAVSSSGLTLGLLLFFDRQSGWRQWKREIAFFVQRKGE